MSGRTRDLLTWGVVRPLLFVFWSLVLWGTLMCGVIAWSCVMRGPGPTWQRLAPPPGPPGLAAWVNLGLAAFAPLVWTLLAYAVSQARRSR